MKDAVICVQFIVIVLSFLLHDVIQGCSQDQHWQDHDQVQDHSSQDQDQDRIKLVSSALKTETARTTCLL